MLYYINKLLILSDMNKFTARLTPLPHSTLFSLSSLQRIAGVALLCVLLWCAIYWANVLP
ncbi:hypothetical protein DVQ33_08380 [Yersinia enterocolitica]|nr:hypothetical protein [Yersinia enterocolitica]EKN5932537.1 hypothetical protein [Yersinia enterocolitica]EKN5942394.1 hypothetical protein [Yersinia enterocolitica]EKN5983227.1 hypothetical protein [Yersinia enterocolitica]EKN5987519.1 hypothetical protein [Yersinia enterocolitica]